MTFSGFFKTAWEGMNPVALRNAKTVAWGWALFGTSHIAMSHPPIRERAEKVIGESGYGRLYGITSTWIFAGLAIRYIHMTRRHWTSFESSSLGPILWGESTAAAEYLPRSQWTRMERATFLLRDSLYVSSIVLGFQACNIENPLTTGQGWLLWMDHVAAWAYANDFNTTQAEKNELYQNAAEMIRFDSAMRKDEQQRLAEEPRGVLRITRHPMVLSCCLLSASMLVPSARLVEGMVSCLANVCIMGIYESQCASFYDRCASFG